MAVMGNTYQRLKDCLTRRCDPQFTFFTRTNVQILTSRTSGVRTGWRGGKSEVYLLYYYKSTNSDAKGAATGRAYTDV